MGNGLPSPPVAGLPPRVIDTGRHEIALLPGSDTIFRVVFAELARATRRIHIECYIVSSDRMGRELYVALDAACKRGVEVKVLYDPLGSNQTDESFFDDLRASGVEVRSYGQRWNATGNNVLGPRDHGRVLVVDDVAVTGGAAWGDQWLPRRLGGRGWHELCCRVTGPVVEDFERLFQQRWGEAPVEEDPHDFDTEVAHPDLRLVSDTPSRASSVVYELHEEAFARARRRIWIANAYFYPPRPMMEALTKAAARGVDVRVLVPADSDLPIIRRAARAEYRDWLAAGLRLHEYVPEMMHAKYAIVDDDWGSVGTFNANPTSVGMANEVNLFLFHEPTVAALAAQFGDDLSRSDEVRAKDLARRPILERVRDRGSSLVFDVANLVWGPR